MRNLKNPGRKQVQKTRLTDVWRVKRTETTVVRPMKMKKNDASPKAMKEKPTTPEKKPPKTETTTPEKTRMIKGKKEKTKKNDKTQKVKVKKNKPPMKTIVRPKREPKREQYQTSLGMYGVTRD